MTYGSLEFISIVIGFGLRLLGFAGLSRRGSRSCVQLRQRNVARELVRLDMARQRGKEVGGEVQGFSLCVFGGLKVCTVPEERCAKYADRTVDGFRLANMSVVYHDSIRGELEMLVEEAYANTLFDFECCE